MEIIHDTNVDRSIPCDELTDELFRTYFIACNSYLIYLFCNIVKIFEQYPNKHSVLIKLDELYEEFDGMNSVDKNAEKIPKDIFMEFMDTVLDGHMNHLLFNPVLLELKYDSRVSTIIVGLRNETKKNITEIINSIDNPSQIHQIVEELFSQHGTSKWEVVKDELDHKDEFKPNKG